MIARRFEDQVERRGSRPALKVAGIPLSYDALNRRANRIAHFLDSTLPRRQLPVAVCAADPGAAVASMLGVLKSGNAWVPLDPSVPRARLAALVEHAPAAAVLTCRDSLGSVSDLAKGHRPVIDVDDLDDGLSELDPAPRAGAADLACILYTSGSTGTPKGVVHDQQNLLHPVEFWTSRFGIDHEDRSLSVASFSHVAAVNDVLRTLLNGACLVPFDLRRSSLQHLAELIERERITIYHSIPSVFRALARTLDGRSVFGHVRLVHLGGEPLFRSDVELFRRWATAKCVLVNNLSATEVQTFAQHVISGRDPVDGPIVPVGRPTEGKRILLVDERGNDVGTDREGEIVVQSASVALGYWKDPERTAAAFGGDPSRREERTFRTGDLGRRRADGVIEYLGRKDDRLKIRGHRIELAEVQFAVHRAAELVGGIEETTVVPRGDPLEEKRLVAYVAPRKGEPVEIPSLRRAVARSLPGPMRPSAWVVVESLPKTVTGKIDRGRLPDPPPPVAEPADDARPIDPLARQLEGLWKQVLGLDSIPRRTGFFELGGHSLLALELIDEIDKLLGVAITLPELADAATLEGVMRLVNDRPDRRPWPALVPFKTDGRKTPLFIVHGLGGVVIELREFARELDPDRPVYALQARGVDGVSRPQRSVQEMAATYLAEVRSARPEGPYILCGYSMGGVVAYEMAQQLAAHGARVEALVLIDAPAPLRMGLADRIRLMRLGGGMLAARLSRVRNDGARRRSRYGRQLDRIRLSNFRAVRRYRPRPYDGAIEHVVSRLGPEASVGLGEGLEQLFLAKRDLWKQLARRGVVTREVTGHHLDLMRPPALEGVVSQVRASLAALEV